MGVMFLGLKDKIKGYAKERAIQKEKDRSYYEAELAKARAKARVREDEDRRARLKAKAQRNAMSRKETVKKNLRGALNALNELNAQPQPVKRSTTKKKTVSKKKRNTGGSYKKSSQKAKDYFNDDYWDGIV